jgi:CRP-like cAMP-binding protein
MAVDALVKPFLSLPLFRGLKPLQLTEIVRRADRIVYRAGDMIAEENCASDAAIVIISGDCVRLTGDSGAEIGEPVPEGAIICELAMLVETVHSSSVIARTNVRALRLNRSDMHQLMGEDLALAEHMSHVIARRLKALADELKAIDRALVDIVNLSGTEQRPALHHQQHAHALH